LTVSIRLTRRSLSFAAAARELEGPGLGGVVLFAGRVRAERSTRTRVVALDYEVHEGPALEVMRELDRTARRTFGAERTVLWHRVGRVRAGEVSVIVGAACGHRAPAFAAARFLIDELKGTVPIWKEERARSERRPPRRPRPPAERSTD
jgi:molybdopterin synthase catalytic subunit